MGLKDFNSLSSVRESYITIDDSLGQNPKATIVDAAYLLLSPHDASDEDDPLGVKRFPDEVMDQWTVNEKLRQQYLNSERDVGSDQLRREILRICRGGVSVSVELNRGICNANKESGSEPLPNIWTPEARRVVQPVLERIHKGVVGDIDVILGAVRRGVRIVCLHSMDPWSFPKDTRPALSPETFQKYIEAQGLPSGMKRPRVEDFIIGQDGQSAIADVELYGIMKGLFDRDGIPWGDNNPYDTDPDYPDHRYMRTYPGSVSAIDLTKTRLCVGDFHTFDWKNPVVDQAKVEYMASLYGQALRAFLKR